MNIKSFLILAAAAAAAGCSTVREPAFDTLISHRGESKDAPENTMAAFKTAVERGFGFECDVYLSKDKQLFTFHDSNLSRTTGGANNELCTEASWEDTLSKINVGGWGKWKGSKFDPSRPALLSEVLSLARDGRYIYVEIKATILRGLRISKLRSARRRMSIPAMCCLLPLAGRSPPRLSARCLSIVLTG